MAANAATRVQNLFVPEELRSMGKHVIPEVFLPLWIHFRKTGPFETEALGCLQLQRSTAVGNAVRACGQTRERSG